MANFKGMAIYIRAKSRKVTKIRNLVRDHDVGMSFMVEYFCLKMLEGVRVNIYVLNKRIHVVVQGL